MKHKVVINYCGNIFLRLRKILSFRKRKIFIWLRLVAPFLVQYKLSGLMELQYKFCTLAKFAFNVYGAAERGNLRFYHKQAHAFAFYAGVKAFV